MHSSRSAGDSFPELNVANFHRYEVPVVAVAPAPRLTGQTQSASLIFFKMFFVMFSANFLTNIALPSRL